MLKGFKLWITLVSLVALIAGCTGGGDKAASSSSPAASSSSSAGSSAQPAGNKEKFDLTIMIPSYEGGGWPEKHPVIDELNKKLNINLKLNWVPIDSYEEKIGVLSASNSFPDAYRINTPTTYQKWIKNKLFLDLTDIVASGKYANLKSKLNEREYQVLNPKGKIYALPYFFQDTRDTLVVRKDWMEALNLKAPETIDQFYETAKTLVQKNPDGVKDLSGISFSILNNTDFSVHMDFFKYAYGLANGWKNVNGQLVPWQAQANELKGFLGFLRKAYEEGVLDKDFAVNKTQDPDRKFEAGKVAFGNAVPATVLGLTLTELKKLKPTADILQLAPPKGANGQQGTSTGATILSKLVINNNIDKAKQERLLELFDYMLSDEGDRLIKNGVENLHYKKEGDKFVKLPAFDTDRPTIMSLWVLRKNDPLTTKRLWSDPKEIDYVTSFYKLNEKYRWANDGLGLFSDTQNKLGSQIGQQFMTSLVKIILGKEPVDSLDKAITDWKKAGGDKIIEEINAEFKAQ